MEQPTNKVKKCKSLQEFKLLLKQSGNLLCTCSALALGFWLPVALFRNFKICFISFNVSCKIP